MNSNKRKRMEISDVYNELWMKTDVLCQGFQKYGLFTPLPKIILPYHSEEHRASAKSVLFNLICLKLLHPFVNSHQTYKSDMTMQTKYENIDAYIIGQYVQPLLLYDTISEHEKEMLTQFFTTQT